jgi:hypothetical protein
MPVFTKHKQLLFGRPGFFSQLTIYLLGLSYVRFIRQHHLGYHQHHLGCCEHGGCTRRFVQQLYV